MPRPKSLWSKVVRPMEFRFEGWEDVLGNKRCFHVVGFNELMRQLGLHIRPNFVGAKAKIPTERLAAAAVDLVPDKWKEEFGEGDKRRFAEWTTFGVEQVLSCNSGQPVLLQKAMIALIFAEKVVEHISKLPGRNQVGTIDVYAFLSIEPAVYWVSGFDETFYKNVLNGKVENISRREGLLNDLLKATSQTDPNVFDEITRDRCTCLHSTATGIIKELRRRKTPGIGSKVGCQVFATHDKGPAAKCERVTVKRPIPSTHE